MRDTVSVLIAPLHAVSVGYERSRNGSAMNPQNPRAEGRFVSETSPSSREI